MSNAHIFARLLIAQALGDVALQTSYMGYYKAYNPLILLAHSAVVAGSFWFMFGMKSYTMWIFYVTLISHFVIDGISSRMKPASGSSLVTLIDCFCHGLVMLYIWAKIRGDI